MRKKVVVFSGAGMSKESGILTFRDVKDGLWNNHKVDEVATLEGWVKDRKRVLDFYNERRAELPKVKPNIAHEALASLEKDYDVTIITQNVDDLHERGGSTNIIHLHGELTKARGSLYHNKVSQFDPIVDIGYNDIKIGDKCSESDSQLRPHIVWFGEYPLDIDLAYRAMKEADILIIVGTSLQIGYTLNLINEVKHKGDELWGGKKPCEIYYIDPKPMHYLDNYGLKINYIRKKATEGVTQLVNKLITKSNKKMYRPLPDYLTIKPSTIEGLGLFTNDDIDSKHVLGISHIYDLRFPNSYIRTPLGGFFNHSETPNCEVVVDGYYLKLKALRDIEAGEEITAKYTFYNPTER